MRRPTGVTKSRVLLASFSFITIFSIMPCTTSAIFLNDFLVNSEAQYYYDDFPQVVVDRRGNFNVVWIKYRYFQNQYTSGRAYLKRFDPDGNVVLPATPLTPDSMFVGSPTPAAILPSGKLVVTWADYTTQFYGNPPYVHSYAQIYDSLAQPITEPFRVDYLTADNIFAFVMGIGVDSTGHLLILWYEDSYQEIYVQRFTEGGIAIDAPIRADTCIEVECSDSENPHMAVHPDGHFVVVWHDNVVEYNGYIPVGRLYDTGFQPVWPGAKLLTCDSSVSTLTLNGSQGACIAGGWTDVAMNQNSHFMIVYSAAAGELYSNSIYGRLFNELGTALTPNLKINTVNPQTYDVFPRVNPDPQGGYYVMWSDCRYSTHDGVRDVFLQRLDSLGNPIGENWRVNTPRGSSKFNRISFDLAVSGDRAFIAWRDYREWTNNPTDSLFTNIYGQIVDVSKIGFYIPGDANFDGGLSVSDVIYLANYILKGSSPPDPEIWIGDVNADCRVTLADVIYLVNYIFKPGWQPPVKGCAE